MTATGSRACRSSTGLKFNIVPESATRQVGVTSGQYALLPNIDAATALQLKGKPGVKLGETLELAYTLIGLNVVQAALRQSEGARGRELRRQPRGDHRCRAVRRRRARRAALAGAQGLGARCRKQFPCYKPDPAKAQALLKEAGVATPVAVTMNVLPRQDIKDIAQVVQQQLNKAGFKVELKNQELGQFVQDWRNSQLRHVRLDQRAAARTRTIISTAPSAPAARPTCSNTRIRELDELLDKARANLDQAARKAAYDEAQKILACEGPVAHLPTARCSRRCATTCRATTLCQPLASSRLRDRQRWRRDACRAAPACPAAPLAPLLKRSPMITRAPAHAPRSISRSCCSACRSSSS